ncbi:BRISC complex subunit Abro1-like protein [Wolffia australiana]
MKIKKNQGTNDDQSRLKGRGEEARISSIVFSIAMEGSSIQKISIWGTTLASLIQRFSSSSWDGDGLLLGRVTRLPPPDPTDDEPSSSTSPFCSAIITNFFCFDRPMNFYDSLGRVDRPKLQRILSQMQWPENCAILGWFSSRRSSGFRPSMRERAISISLSKAIAAPDRGGRCVFMLISSSTGSQSIHTHDYRAYTLESIGGGCALNATPLEVVNLGPDFRCRYNIFSPESSFPWMNCGSGSSEFLGDKSLLISKKIYRDSASLAAYTEGYTLESLRRMVGANGERQKTDVEQLYESMLLKLEGLAKLVEKSSAEILEQEDRNREGKR